MQLIEDIKRTWSCDVRYTFMPFFVVCLFWRVRGRFGPMQLIEDVEGLGAAMCYCFHRLSLWLFVVEVFS